MRALLFLLLIGFSTTINGQVTKAAIKDLSFISGHWTLQHEWGDMEEVWSAPMGNNMMGSYRCVKEGKVVFYEFMVIEQKDSVPVLYLRHFGPGSVAWEEKEAPGIYTLVLLQKGKAQFKEKDSGTTLTFTRQSPTQLQIVLDSKTSEGTPEKVVFDFRLKGF